MSRASVPHRAGAGRRRNRTTGIHASWRRAELPAYPVAAGRAPGAEPSRVRWFCLFCPLTVRLCVSCWAERVRDFRRAEMKLDDALAESGAVREAEGLS